MNNEENPETPEISYEGNYFDRSISSIINLNDLLADIDTEKQNGKRKSRHSNRNNSFDQHSEKSQMKKQE